MAQKLETTVGGAATAGIGSGSAAAAAAADAATDAAAVAAVQAGGRGVFVEASQTFLMNSALNAPRHQCKKSACQHKIVQQQHWETITR